MIFGGQPKYRDGLNSSGVEFACKADDCDGFVQRISGPKEKPNLLAADNRASSVPEFLDASQSLRAGGPTPVLLEQHFRNMVSALSRNSSPASMICKFIEESCVTEIEKKALRTAA